MGGGPRLPGSKAVALCRLTHKELMCRMDSYLIQVNGQGDHVPLLDIHLKTNGNSMSLGKVKGRKPRWAVRASEMSKKTFNPVRAIVDSMKVEPNPKKAMISLSLGEHSAVAEASEQLR
uniref:Uncharacterized protein n=1 Tax=Meleagris gallopavo TaxID=9103 RepID=A0A803YGB1_MELGA